MFVRRARSVFSSLTVLALVAAPLAAQPAWAEDAPADPGAPSESLAWSVVPANPEGPDGRGAFDFAVAAGSTITDWVTVGNHSGQTGTFHVHAADAVTDYDSAQITLISSGQSSTGLGAWSSIDGGPTFCPEPAEAACLAGLGTVVELGPGQSATVPVSIQVPADATPGDHVAGIVASHLSTDVDENATRVLREDRVGMRVFLRVDGELAPAVEINGQSTSFRSDWNPFSGGTSTVGFELHNSGNTRINSAPTVALTGPFGIPLGTQSLEAVTELLPGGTGYVSTAFTGVPPILLLWGTVEIVAQAPGVEAQLTASSEAITWALPWSLLALLALIAAAIWLWRWSRRRRRTRMAEDLADYTRTVLERERGSRNEAPAAERGAEPGAQQPAAPSRQLQETSMQQTPMQLAASKHRLTTPANSTTSAECGARRRRMRGPLALLLLAFVIGASALAAPATALAEVDDAQIEFTVPERKQVPEEKPPPGNKPPPNTQAPIPAAPVPIVPPPNRPAGMIAVNDPAPVPAGDAVCTPAEPVLPTAPTKNAEKASVNREVAVAGDSVTVRATGYGAGEQVQAVMFSEPTLLGTFTADAAGEVAAEFTVGEDVAAGAHTVQLTGWCKHVAAVQLLVGQTAETAAGWAMPVWGWWVLGILLLLAAGVVIWRVIAARSHLEATVA